MAVLTWDVTGEKFFETGVDHGVLFPMDALGDYPLGVPWNGLIGVTESPSGGEPTALWADNVKYLTLISSEELSFTIEAYMYPPEFELCDGSAEPTTGMNLYQQTRKSFGLAYRTIIGNDVEGLDLGYRLHLVYGCLAKPAERAYKSVNDSPEANTFSWEVSTTPPPAIPGFRPSALITIDSRTADPAFLTAIENQLFGTAIITSNLPLPADVLALDVP